MNTVILNLFSVVPDGCVWTAIVLMMSATSLPRSREVVHDDVLFTCSRARTRAHAREVKVKHIPYWVGMGCIHVQGVFCERIYGKYTLFGSLFGMWNGIENNYLYS